MDCQGTKSNDYNNEEKGALKNYYKKLDETNNAEREKADLKLLSEIKKLDDFKKETALQKEMEKLKIDPSSKPLESPKKEETEMERVKRMVDQTTKSTNEVNLF